MIIMGNMRAAVDGVKSELRTSFEITDQGELSWLLGFEVRRNGPARMLALNQKAYIESLAKRFVLEKGRAVHIAMDPNVVLSKDQYSISVQRNRMAYCTKRRAAECFGQQS